MFETYFHSFAKKIALVLIFLISFLSIICILALNTNVYAADMEWRFTHNDHDTLVIGKIIDYENGYFQIEPYYFIVSSQGKKEQQAPEKIFIFENKFWYDASNEADRMNYSSGSYILASLNKAEQEDVYEVAWGIYPISSTDIVAMEFLKPIDEIKEEFIRSAQATNRGYIAELSIDNTSVPKAFLLSAQDIPRINTHGKIYYNFIFAVVFIITSLFLIITLFKKAKSSKD